MSSNSSPSSRTILSILAHPDDESFGMGGTLALYASRGAAVHLICATRGEAGTLDAKYLIGYASIAERRENELRCAAGKLGLAEVHLLDYRDSGMPGMVDNQHPQALINAPLEVVAAQIAGYIRRLRPQIVLTFDPIGGYKHPDHIAIHKATLRGFEMAADPAFIDGNAPHQAARLYYHIIPKGFLRFGVGLLRLLGKDPHHFGRNGDIDLAELVEEGDFPVHAKINYSQVMALKDEASLCHASQLDGAGLRRGPMRWVQTIFGQQDFFMRAFPPPQKGEQEKDLFAGLTLGD